MILCKLNVFVYNIFLIYKNEKRRTRKNWGFGPIPNPQYKINQKCLIIYF